MDTSKTKLEADATSVEIKIVCNVLQAYLCVTHASIIWFFSLDSARKNVLKVIILKMSMINNAKNAIQETAWNVKEIKTIAQYAFLITTIWVMESVHYNVQEVCFLHTRIIVFLVDNAIYLAEQDALEKVQKIA